MEIFSLIPTTVDSYYALPTLPSVITRPPGEIPVGLEEAMAAYLQAEATSTELYAIGVDKGGLWHVLDHIWEGSFFQYGPNTADQIWATFTRTRRGDGAVGVTGR